MAHVKDLWTKPNPQGVGESVLAVGERGSGGKHAGRRMVNG